MLTKKRCLKRGRVWTMETTWGNTIEITLVLAACDVSEDTINNLLKTKNPRKIKGTKSEEERVGTLEKKK